MITYLHGFLGGPEDWAPLSELLPAPFCTVSSPHEIQKPTTLVGYSLGGRLALDFASHHPDLIENLIILSANPGMDDPLERKARREWDQKWCEMIQREGFSFFLKKWYDQPLFSSLRKREDFPAILERRMKNDPEETIKIFQTLSPGVLPSCWNAIKKFSFPTLFLFGDRDIKYHFIRKKLEDLSMKVALIQSSGHAVHLENPEACAQTIKEFLCLPV